eukprot:scaffold60834_cov44-Attheya_sp.AAC.5
MTKASTSVSKKEKLLKSIITSLDKDDVLKESNANGHAHAMRASLRLDNHQPQKSDFLDGALEDAQLACQILPREGKHWRILADALEAAGDPKGAMDAIQQWAQVDPAFRTKAQKELARLSQL